MLEHPKTKKRIEQGKLPALNADQVQASVRISLENGLRKILSKIGISLLASYHGAQIFEAIGLGADVIETAFSGTTSRVAGMTLAELANETLSMHAKAFPELDRTKLEFMALCSTAAALSTTATTLSSPKRFTRLWLKAPATTTSPRTRLCWRTALSWHSGT